MSVSVSYHEGVTKLQEFGASVPISGSAGPFDNHDWFVLLADASKAPLTALAKSERGAIALPLERRPEGLFALTNWFSFIWRPVSLTSGADANASPMADPDVADLLRALAADLRRQEHRVVFSPVGDEHGDAAQLFEAFKAAGWRCFMTQCDENHVLPVNGRKFAEYWASRPGRMRTTLKRKAKKVDVQLLTEFDEAIWHQYQAIYRSSWKPEEEQWAMLETFARREGEKGHLRLAIASHNGEPVAAQFWTVENKTAYIHKLAHIEAAKSLSAGTTLSAALFEHVIDKDCGELVDFGTGSDAYKRDWMELNRPRYLIECLNPSRAKAWPILIKRTIRRLASTLMRG